MLCLLPRVVNRDRKMTGARMLVGIGTGAIIGLAFRSPKGAALTQGEIDNTLGFLFTVSIFSMITNFFQVRLFVSWVGRANMQEG
jgi:hypothetical protein